MRHLTEDILIQYQFDLLSDGKRQEATEHLAGCQECRETLAGLQTKFGMLDVLTATEAVPEELVAKTAAAVRQTPSAGRKPALPWRPLLAAAAVLIAGVLWVNRPVERVEETPAVLAMKAEDADATRQYAMKQQTLAETDTLSEALGSRLQRDDREIADNNANRLSRRLRSGLLSESDLDGGDRGVRVARAEEIPEEPPFAPASAIELVVLPRPEAMQVTIYNAADLTLVRDTRKLVLKPGWNWLQFMWAQTKIDPTSLSLRPLEHADRIEVEQLVYPAGLTEIGRWLVRSEVEGAVEFEITYFTSGLSWRAVYEGTLSADERTMNLTGYVRVDNHSGQDYVNTQTRLLLGQVRLLDEIKMLAERKYPYGPNMPDEEKGVALERSLGFRKKSKEFMGGTSIVIELKDVEKQGLSEYTLYTIEGTEDLQDGWGKRLESLDAGGIPVKSVYKYDEDRYGKRAVRFITFANDDEHELGASPLPEGSIRIFRTVSDAQNLSYVGQSAFKYIPVGQEAELNLGSSALVTVEPKLMELRTEAYIFDPNNNVAGWDEVETWTIELTNTRGVPAEIEVTRNFGTEAWEVTLNPKLEIRNSKQIQNTNDRMGETDEGANDTPSPLRGTPPWQGESFRDVSADLVFGKLDKERGRFTVTVEAQSKAAFTFTVRKHLGRRAEETTEIETLL